MFAVFDNYFMTVLLVILHAERARGGAEAYTLQLFIALRAAGEDVRIAAASFDDTIPAEARVPLAHAGLTRSRRYRSFLDALDRHLSQTNYDVVHAMLPVRKCDVYHPHAGVADRMAGGRAKRLLNPRPGVFAAVERELIHDHAPVILSLSSYIDAELSAAYPGQTLKIKRLMNAVDLERFDVQSSRRTGASPVIHSRENTGEAPVPHTIQALIVAQDFNRKGVPELLEVIRPLDVRLTVVGQCDLKSWRARAARLGVGERVKFVGLQKDVRPFYHAADVFVLPTRHDPCSLVVLEALACGVPVITTKQNGAADLMTPGVHGIILDRQLPTFVNDLTAAVQIMSDEKTRAAMAAACRELRPTLSYQHHLDRLRTIYHSLAD